MLKRLVSFAAVNGCLVAGSELRAANQAKEQPAELQQTEGGGEMRLPGVKDVLSSSVDTISRLKTQVSALNKRIKNIATQEQKRVAAAKIGT